jgi:Domain of unknown function (DUF4349)
MPRRILKTIGLALFSIQLGCAASMAPPMEPSSRSYEATADVAESAPAPGALGGLAMGVRGGEMDGAVAMNGGAPPPPPPPPPAATSTAGPSSEVQRGPMLIYTATMNLAVFQVAEASKQVEVMAKEAGGFLARRDDMTVVIRVPAAKFDDLLKRIEKLGDVLHRNVAAEDVTEQFMDIEVRLKNARAVRDRLQALLDKATKVEESLEIEKELTRVGTEIETLEGKLKYLRDRVTFSTITVSFRPKQSDSVKPSVRIPVGWLNQLGLGRLLDL